MIQKSNVIKLMLPLLLPSSIVRPMNITPGLFCNVGASLIGANAYRIPRILEDLFSNRTNTTLMPVSLEVREFVLDMLREKGVSNYNTFEIGCKGRMERSNWSHESYAVSPSRVLFVPHFLPVAAWGMITAEKDPSQAYELKFGALDEDDIARADFMFMDLETALQYEKRLRMAYDSVQEAPVRRCIDLAYSKVKQQLDKHKAIIQHEIGHINQFGEYVMINSRKIPFLLSFLVSLPIVINIPGGIAYSLLSLVGSGLISNLLNRMIKRHYEKRADDSVEDTEATLLASSDHYRHDLYRLCICYLARKSDIVKMPPEDLMSRVLNFVADCLDNEHPSPEMRARRFDERLAKLRKCEQSQQQLIEDDVMPKLRRCRSFST